MKLLSGRSMGLSGLDELQTEGRMFNNQKQSISQQVEKNKQLLDYSSGLCSGALQLSVEDWRGLCNTSYIK